MIYVYIFSTADWLIEMMKKSLKITGSEEKAEQKLEQLDLDGVAKFIAAEKCSKVITMAGAGISTCKYLCELV